MVGVPLVLLISGIISYDCITAISITTPISMDNSMVNVNIAFLEYMQGVFHLETLPWTLLHSILPSSSAKVSMIRHVNEESKSDSCTIQLHLLTCPLQPVQQVGSCE